MSFATSEHYLHLLTLVPVRGVQEVVAAVARGGAEAAGAVTRAISSISGLQTSASNTAPAPPWVTGVTRAAGEVEAGAEAEGFVEQTRLAPGSQAWKMRINIEQISPLRLVLMTSCRRLDRN